MMKRKLYQVKSRWYYIFWGICTISVVAGQLYVGTGYRIMANSFNTLIYTAISEIESPKKVYE